MNEATFTFRVEEELKESFATAAKARDRTGAQLLRDFMRDFVKKQQVAIEHDVWVRRQVQVGLDAANAGKLVSAEKVEAEFAKRRGQTRQKRIGFSNAIGQPKNGPEKAPGRARRGPQ